MPMFEEFSLPQIWVIPSVPCVAGRIVRRKLEQRAKMLPWLAKNPSTPPPQSYPGYSLKVKMQAEVAGQVGIKTVETVGTAEVNGGDC